MTPTVSAPTTLGFQLVVNDGQQDSAPAMLSLTLIPLASQTVNSRNVRVDRTAGSATAELQWGGLPGDRVVIQASRDLIQWEDVATNSVGFLQSILYTDLRAGLFPYRFYRAVSRPAPPPPTHAELHFDGVDDYVEVPHDGGLNTYPLSITVWVKTTQNSPDAGGIVCKYDETIGNGYALLMFNGRARAWYFRDGDDYIWDGGLGLDGGFIADGQWHHLALTVAADAGKLYVDGSLRSSLPWRIFSGTAGPPSTTRPLLIGRYSTTQGGSYSGLIDEPAVWNRTLTAAEINQMIPGKLTGAETGLLGFWPFDEGTGPIASDASGHGRNGALRNGPVWFDSTAPLRPNPTAGSALRFDGVDDVVTVSHNPALNAFPLTVAGWIKTAQNFPGYVAVANKYPGGSGNGYSLHINNGHIAAFYFRGDGVSYVYAGDPGLDGGFIADGQWHHVAYVVDVSGGRIYVDGTQTVSLGWTGTPGGCTTAAPILFGQYSGAQSLDGRLDEITLWNRALDASEVNAVKNFKQTGAESGLIAFWPFDNGSGTTATDATGHGYNGALQNGPLWVPSDAPVYP
jgi:hypothetical protein